MSAFGIASAVRLAFQGSHLQRLARGAVWLVGLAATAAFAAPALAAVGDRIPFQQFRNQVCPQAWICSVNYGVVPANARLEIHSVSCFLFTTAQEANVARSEFDVFKAGGEFIMREHAVPLFTGANQFGRFFAVSNRTFFFVPAGGRVQFRVNMRTETPVGLELDCKIAGERVIVAQ